MLRCMRIALLGATLATFSASWALAAEAVAICVLLAASENAAH